MGLTGIVDLLLDSATFTDVLRRVEQGAISTHISGLSGRRSPCSYRGCFGMLRARSLWLPAHSRTLRACRGIFLP